MAAFLAWLICAFHFKNLKIGPGLYVLWGKKASKQPERLFIRGCFSSDRSGDTALYLRGKDLVFQDN
jgi:hypothetical protein